MPRAYRAGVIILSLLIVMSGALGLYGATRLSGWPQLRGAAGGLITVGFGLWLLACVVRDRWPRWLAAVLGEDDAV
jgi:hypothetical protein